MADQNGDGRVDIVSEHPWFCDPRECLVGPDIAFQRHRSVPQSFTLPDDICHTRFVTRVTESLIESGVSYLEVDVYRDGEDEPVTELRFTVGDLFDTMRFFNGLLKPGGLMEAGFVARQRP